MTPPPAFKVPVIALDDLSFPLPVSLMKIDVEGAEPAALASAKLLLGRDKPVVYFEVLGAKQLDGAFNLLKEQDYRLYWIERRQFNRNNFCRESVNIWGPTEMGVLALASGVEVGIPLREISSIPAEPPHVENAREGVSVAGGRKLDQNA